MADEVTVAETSVGPIEIGGSPSDQEIAAIVAAIEMAWPKPSAPKVAPQISTKWRYSGRWWSEGRLPNRWS